VERDIRFDLIARLCPNTTGAELRSVATEVCRGMPQSMMSIISPGIKSRLACLPSVRGARSLLNVTSLMQLRRSSGKARNSLARKCTAVS
jgi:hypothetical protein